MCVILMNCAFDKFVIIPSGQKFSRAEISAEQIPAESIFTILAQHCDI